MAREVEQQCQYCNNWDKRNQKTSSRLMCYCDKGRGYKEPDDGKNCPDASALPGYEFKTYSGPCFITTAVVNMCGFGDNARILYTMRQLRTKMQETEEGQERLKKYDVEGPIIAQKLAEESEPLLFGYKIISEYLIPTAGEVQKAEALLAKLKSSKQDEKSNLLNKAKKRLEESKRYKAKLTEEADKHYKKAEDKYCNMIDCLKNLYGIKEDASEYEYDSDVRPAQMGHGTARVHKVSVNRR